MRIQLLSDLHLETERFHPKPAPGAELLVLGGDIDATWEALERFAGWPVPVLMVAGNHEFDGRELGEAWDGLRERCGRFGIRLLERETWTVTAASGLRIRFVATVRWSDFDGCGAPMRDKAMRAASYFLSLMGSRIGERPLDAEALREASLACRAWLQEALAEPLPAAPSQRWDRTVAITHFAPSLRSADPRFGRQPSTASFCNADDDLIPLADVWLHGHLHCRHDYQIPRSGGRPPTRVICNAMGLASKGEDHDFDPMRLFDLA